MHHDCAFEMHFFKWKNDCVELRLKAGMNCCINLGVRTQRKVTKHTKKIHMKSLCSLDMIKV